MNEYERERIRKSQAVIAKIAVDGKKIGLSYGQMQARSYEQQLKIEKAIEKCDTPALPSYEGTKNSKGGRPKKPLPEGFDEVAELILSGNLTMQKAGIAMNVSNHTVKRWMDEWKAAAKAVEYK